MELRELVTTLQKLRRAVVFARRAVCEELDGYDSPVYVSTVPTIVYVQINLCRISSLRLFKRRHFVTTFFFTSQSDVF